MAKCTSTKGPSAIPRPPSREQHLGTVRPLSKTWKQTCRQHRVGEARSVNSPSIGLVGVVSPGFDVPRIVGSGLFEERVLVGRLPSAVLCDVHPPSGASIPAMSVNGGARPTSGTWASLAAYCSHLRQRHRLPQPPAFVDTAAPHTIPRHSGPMRTQISVPSTFVVGGRGVSDALPALIMVQIPWDAWPPEHSIGLPRRVVGSSQADLYVLARTQLATIHK